MRPVKKPEIMIFALHFVLIMGCAILGGMGVYYGTPWEPFRPILSLIAFIVVMYSVAILAYRLYFSFFPLKEGVIESDSIAENRYNLSVLYLIIFFRFLTQSKLVIVPLTGLMYRALGAQVGKNTYFVGHLLDPLLTTVGDNSIVGQGAIIYTHSVEGLSLSQHKVTIGSGVTIGAMSVIMGGAKIGDNAIIAAGAVVSKRTVIGEGETWGGVPARLLKPKPS